MHVLDDLTDRLERAVKALDQLLREADTEHEVQRLSGKREGVQLALSYVREYERV